MFLVLIVVFCFCSLGQKVGDKVDVLWNGTYYKANVKKVADSKWFIHYDGYESSWDEWVGKDRIKVITKTGGNNKGGKTDVNSENNTGQNNSDWKVGDKLKVGWNNTWYPSTIIQVGDGKYKIYYDNYSNSYDEWVTPARMKKN